MGNFILLSHLVLMFPDHSIYFGEFNIIITDRIHGQYHENKTQIVIYCSIAFIKINQIKLIL